jgi:hypothetical protein
MAFKDKIIIDTFRKMQEVYGNAVSADDIVLFDEYRDTFLQIYQKSAGFPIPSNERGMLFKQLINLRKRSKLPKTREIVAQ